MTLFEKAQVVGTFLGFSEGGLEFHADLILPYQNYFQSSPMHGQFVLVALENDAEAILGRITTISAQGRLISPPAKTTPCASSARTAPFPKTSATSSSSIASTSGSWACSGTGTATSRPFSSRRTGGCRMSAPRSPSCPMSCSGTSLGLPPMVCTRSNSASSPSANSSTPGRIRRVGDDERLQIRDPAVLPRFDILHLVSRRSFVFARAGFGKSNLVKLLFANLYGGAKGPVVREERAAARCPVGTVIFDPDGEYYWPDDKGRPGLCDVPALQDRLVVFTDKEGPSEFYRSFAVDKVRLDIRELEPAKVISLVIPAERQEHQNIAKLKQLRARSGASWSNEVWLGRAGRISSTFTRPCSSTPGSRRTRRSPPGRTWCGWSPRCTIRPASCCAR